MPVSARLQARAAGLAPSQGKRAQSARQGVSAYENHALIPHEAYQALYAAGEAQKIFSGYKVQMRRGLISPSARCSDIPEVASISGRSRWAG